MPLTNTFTADGSTASHKINGGSALMLVSVNTGSGTITLEVEDSQGNWVPYGSGVTTSGVTYYEFGDGVAVNVRVTASSTSTPDIDVTVLH